MHKHKLISKKPSLTSKTKKNEEEEDDDKWVELVTCEDNHIYFYDDVNTKSILILIKYIKQLNVKLLTLETEVKLKYNTSIDMNIYLHINSRGGYITDAFAALDYIQKSKLPIISIIDGYAASAATFLSIVCNKRQITSFSSMLIHQLSSEASGNFEQINDDYINCQYLQNCIKKLYIEHSNGKLNNKKLDNILKHDLMWDAKKCLEMGLVDEII